jgi:hypothetical protein
MNTIEKSFERYRLILGFYLFHESMLESVIYARDHFLSNATLDEQHSTWIFPSHAYLVRRRQTIETTTSF